MKTYKLALILSLFLASAPLATANADCDICNWQSLFERKTKEQGPREIKITSYSEGVINLQHLNTRRIVNCHSNNMTSAEDCARYFEQYGFVRFRNIPYKTANYDFLQVDTYPTRRWRNSELTSRW